METIKEYKLKSLNKNSVTVVIENFVNIDGNKYPVGKKSVICYNNNIADRDTIKNILPENYYNAIIVVWGDTPTVKDIPQPVIH